MARRIACSCRRFLFVVGLWALHAVSAMAQCRPPARAELLAETGAPGDYLGTASSANVDRVAVGARHHDGLAVDSGAVYVFERVGDSWASVAEIPAPADHLDFGKAISLEGDRMLVGSRDVLHRGWVHVIERTNGVWSEVDALTNADVGGTEKFGSAVYLQGDRFVAGDFSENGSRGAAYVYDRVAGVWTRTARLAVASGRANDEFGVDVAFDGTTVVVGARGELGPFGPNGAVHVYDDDGVGGWTEVAVLTGSSPTIDFGTVVDLAGDVFAAGTPHDPEFGTNSGAAWVFERASGTWSEVMKLSAAGAQLGDIQGDSISLDGPARLVVGAHGNDDVGDAAGAAHVYEKVSGTWRETATLYGSDSRPGDQVGKSVSASGGTVVIGGPFHDDRGDDSGAAYVFDVSPLATRAGNVNAGSGAITDVLFLNGQSGEGAERLLRVAPSDSFELRIDGPPSMPDGARYVVYAWRGEPTPLTCESLPRGVGTIAMPTPLSGRAPQPVRRANTLGPRALGRENWPAHFSPTRPAPWILLSLPSGVHRIGRFTFQGIIQDPTAPVTHVAVTNGIVVSSE
ncbi:MAG: hypothetical protein HYR85_08410 [Planctomycetes bacterium]|nr:hypothetical protein [Planctomycetota bacterium]